MPKAKSSLPSPLIPEAAEATLSGTVHRRAGVFILIRRRAVEPIWNRSARLNAL
jgi:hypothetical protein